MPSARRVSGHQVMRVRSLLALGTLGLFVSHGVVACNGVNDGDVRPLAQFRSSKLKEAQCCTAAFTDVCNWGQDEFCDSGCLWGLDPACATGQNKCGDGNCQIALGESCESCGQDCCGAAPPPAPPPPGQPPTQQPPPDPGAGGTGGGGTGGAPPMGGNTPAFHACNDSGQCRAGVQCIEGACVPSCQTDTECGTGRCMDLFDSGGTPIPGQRVCTAGCYPPAPGAPSPGFSACGPDLHCVAFSDTSTCVGPAYGFGQFGAPCYDEFFAPDDSRCAPGHLCVDFLPPQCTPLCIVGQAACPAGFDCVGLGQSLSNGQQLGFCG